MTENVDSDRLACIFFPYAQSRTAAIIASGDRVAYYTTAEVATRILTSRQIWFRNTLVMNDFKEIAHGFECLDEAYRGSAGEALKAALESCFPGLSDDVEAIFKDLLPSIRSETYLFCVSEHPSHEDLRGRLSMWRAYGGSTGVALVMNGAVMHAESDVLGVYSSPVYYANPPEFAEELTRVASHIQNEVAYLQEVGKEAVREMVLAMMHFAVLCTKHPGFQEELEWRVIASPALFPAGRREYSVEVVHGVPQLVVKLSLENQPDEGLIGLALPELLERIIIGPCKFPLVTAQAFHRLLADAGVSNPQERVIIADIPLRHNA